MDLADNVRSSGSEICLTSMLLTTKSSSIRASLELLAIPLSGMTVALISWWTFQLSMAAGLLLYPFVLVFIGTRFRAVNNFSHECLHRAACQSPFWNDILGELSAMFEFTHFRAIRREHLTHHAYLGDFDRDMDFSHLKDYEFWQPMSRHVFFQHLRHALRLGHLGKYIYFRPYDPESPIWAKAARFVFAGLLTAIAWFYPSQVALYLIVPYVTTYQIHKYLMDLIDHGGLLSNTQTLHQTRNCIVRNKVLSWIFFPREDGYHLIHHLFPKMATTQFKRAHALLLNDARYASIPHSAKEHWREWAR